MYNFGNYPFSKRRNTIFYSALRPHGPRRTVRDPGSLSIKTSPLKGNTLIAKQALDEAIAKHGRRMADAENYPASRDVVQIDMWRSEFLKMRVDSGAQEASVVKDFTRQSKKLQEQGIVHGYSQMVWLVHDEDRQDI